MTQQNLSQIENGLQAMSYEQRQRAVAALGISAEDLGLSPGRPRAELDSAVAVHHARWRQERRRLNQHRCDSRSSRLGCTRKVHRVPGTPLIAGSEWILEEPAELRSLRLALDEQPHPVTVDGSEAETLWPSVGPPEVQGKERVYAAGAFRRTPRLRKIRLTEL